MYFIVVRILGLFQNSNNSTDSSTTGTGPKSILKSNSKSLPKDIVPIHLLSCCFSLLSLFIYIWGELYVLQSFLFMQANVANSVAIELIILCRGLIVAFLL